MVMRSCENETLENSNHSMRSSEMLDGHRSWRVILYWKPLEMPRQLETTILQGLESLWSFSLMQEVEYVVQP